VIHLERRKIIVYAMLILLLFPFPASSQSRLEKGAKIFLESITDVLQALKKTLQAGNDLADWMRTEQIKTLTSDLVEAVSHLRNDKEDFIRYLTAPTPEYPRISERLNSLQSSLKKVKDLVHKLNVEMRQTDKSAEHALSEAISGKTYSLDVIRAALERPGGFTDAQRLEVKKKGDEAKCKIIEIQEIVENFQKRLKGLEVPSNTKIRPCP